ncbi:unnamed protein product, partial [Vitrella brassicaformis CCMP3155]
TLQRTMLAVGALAGRSVSSIALLPSLLLGINGAVVAFVPPLGHAYRHQHLCGHIRGSTALTVTNDAGAQPSLAADRSSPEFLERKMTEVEERIEALEQERAALKKQLYQDIWFSGRASKANVMTQRIASIENLLGVLYQMEVALMQTYHYKSFSPQSPDRTP